MGEVWYETRIIEVRLHSILYNATQNQMKQFIYQLKKTCEKAVCEMHKPIAIVYAGTQVSHNALQ